MGPPRPPGLPAEVATMETQQEPLTGRRSPAWYPDPRHQHQLRYFDGATWTDHVTHLGPVPCPGCSHQPGHRSDQP
jgi:hypothetical protein